MENQIFTSKEFGEIRTHVDEKGEPWFCLADICRVLELQTGNTKQRLDKRGIYSINTPTYNQHGTKVMQRHALGQAASGRVSRLGVRRGASCHPQARGYMTARADEPDEVILSRALLIMQKALERRDKRIAELEPRAAYADEVIDSISCLTTTQVAKGLGMTAIELNRRLCHSHVQYFQSGQYLLYADYARAGYAQNRTYTYRDSEGETRTHSYLVWTERGREFIH